MVIMMCYDGVCTMEEGNRSLVGSDAVDACVVCWCYMCDASLQPGALYVRRGCICGNVCVAAAAVLVERMHARLHCHLCNF